MDPQTVGFLLNSLAGGGAERSTLTTVENWPNRKYQAHLLLCSSDGEYHDEIPSAEQVHIVGKSKLPWLVCFAFRVRKVVRENHLVALVVTGDLALRVLFLKQIKVLGDLKIVVIERNMMSIVLGERYPRHFSRRLATNFRRWLYAEAKGVIGVSLGVSRDVEAQLRLPPFSAATIYNPVDSVKILHAISESVPHDLKLTFEGLASPVIVAVGWLRPYKGHEDLLKAFSLLPEKLRGSIVILGEGELRGALTVLSESLGISQRLWMPGFVSNPWWFMSRADVFAFPSRHEGFGRVLVEALICGVPVASTDCDSGPREILYGVPGAELTPVNDPLSLAKAVEHLLDCPSIAASSRRHHIQRFDPKVVARLYEDAIDTLLAPG